MNTVALSQARLAAEDIARDTCRKMAAEHGWKMGWCWDGNRLLIVCDGVPTNAIDIGPVPNATNMPERVAR